MFFTLPYIQRVCCQLTRLFAYIQCHLLYGSDIVEELGEILEEDDLALVLSAEHRPNCLIQLMTHSLKCIKFEDGERSLLVSNELLTPAFLSVFPYHSQFNTFSS